MLLKIIRIILLLFSLYGYSQYLYSRLKLKAELIMPILLSFFGSAIFLGGLLNITKETAAVIFLLGVILCAVSVKRRYSPVGSYYGRYGHMRSGSCSPACFYLRHKINGV